MKNKELLEEFHSLAEKLDIKIMKGKGDFSGGDCIVNEKKVIVINNIKPIDCLNKKLDPNFHQAMIEIEDGQKEPGTIVQEIQKGFTIKDRLLRPSLVGVSKKTEDKVKQTAENKENKENN